VKNGIIEASLHPERKFYMCTVNPKRLQEKLTGEYRAGRTTKHFHTKMMTRLHEARYEL